GDGIRQEKPGGEDSIRAAGPDRACGHTRRCAQRTGEGSGQQLEGMNVPIEDWVQLALTEGIGPILTRRLIDAAGSAEAACAASVNFLSNIEGIGSQKSRTIHQSLQNAVLEAPQEIERAAAMGVSIICPDDELYPTLLRAIPDPPSVLYVKGSLEARDLNAVA